MIMAGKAAKWLADQWTRPLKAAFFPAGRQATEIRFGEFKGLVMDLDYSCQTQVVFGLAERETMPWLPMLTRDIAVAVDVGAAEGEYSLYLLKRTRARHVYAIEPSTSAWPQLLRNLERNALGGDARFVQVPRFAGEKECTQTVTLDKLLLSSSGPVFIKIDVDGGEVDVLRGANNLLCAKDVRLLVETHSEALEDDVCRMLVSAGYVVRVVPNAWWRFLLPERRTSPHNRWCVAWKTGVDE